VLRITADKSDEDTLILQLEGQLIGPWVMELDRLCEESAAHGCRFSIDLTAVSFADRHGISLLKNLRGRGTPVLNGSPFIREQLNED
jgi:anti-anti-sigma regulatory factor